jgi:hypothetical protein
MKKIILILSLVVSALALNAQYFYGGVGTTFDMPRTQFQVDSSGNIRFVPGDFGFSMSVGAGMSSWSGNTSFGTYVSPSFAYNVSERFRLKAGVTMMNNFGSTYYSPYDTYYNPATVTSSRIFVQGDYLVNNKLMLSGAVYKEVSPFNPRITDPNFYAPDGEGFMFNLNYRPSKNVEINATFEYSRGNRAFGYSPFYRPNGYMPGVPW